MPLLAHHCDGQTQNFIFCTAARADVLPAFRLIITDYEGLYAWLAIFGTEINEIMDQPDDVGRGVMSVLRFVSTFVVVIVLVALVAVIAFSVVDVAETHKCLRFTKMQWTTMALFGRISSSSSFICSETQIQYSAKIKAWTLNKTHQAHDKLLWWSLGKKTHKYPKYTKYTKYKIHTIKAP